MSTLKENWRVVALVTLLLLSAVALFIPGVPPGTSGSEGAGAANQSTNLQYGIQLSGGTRIQAPIVGITAEGVEVAPADEADLAQSMSDRLGIDPIDVRVSNRTETVEVFSNDVSTSEVESALEAEGYEPSEVRPGVTRETRENMVSVIDDKLRESALTGGSVQQVSSPGGRSFISVTAPDRGREELIGLLEERGVVRVYAVHDNTENGSYVREEVLSQGDFAGIGSAQRSDTQGTHVPVTVKQSVAERYANDMVEAGFGGGSTCRRSDYDHENLQNTEANCLVTTLNGEPVFVGGVDPGLGQSYQNGDFVNNPQFIMQTSNMSEATELELALKAGRLPAPLNFDSAESQTLSSALAQEFQQRSLLTGILAVIAVSLVVYLRYGRPEVALPMIVTALSEVFILLGFVAFVQYPLNLSHLAGFIAVIGTGVDDLIIIADEILQQGKVETGRVFQSRFRKAFWVIGAAAATTIMAMSPLMVLPLGDLSGFAIITIVGVLVGVLVTRPAYGDILRSLVLDED
ncbi:preprotein translocase subunit SecD [Haloarcula sp. 1CSR25-25]|uniref:preprotein translocase subunit SecD n=1 Tax=Haloarcula sp. 1CSR25-25 TaxID=2862545 RepID=UPI002895F59A|nr:preprotein translocase subunit SecD [Haloarcula sp. 1CSR25-25]MDT3437105.1 preprotein translocase subunit SecD [Haloarcula sp. 1CSR25-25]